MLPFISVFFLNFFKNFFLKKLSSSKLKILNHIIKNNLFFIWIPEETKFRMLFEEENFKKKKKSKFLETNPFLFKAYARSGDLLGKGYQLVVLVFYPLLLFFLCG
jgi:hypothetical protein